MNDDIKRIQFLFACTFIKNRMKNLCYIILFIVISLSISCKSGLVTMTNGCYNEIASGKASNQSGNYAQALDQFNQVLKQCNAYDAKDKGNAGKAEALNGLQQYSDAITAANAGLKANGSSVDNLFQKATAELGLNDAASAKADFNTITNLTQKNRNVKDRATIYAKMAEIDAKQNMYADAMNNVNAALGLDNTNGDFYTLQGDVYLAQNNFSQAMQSYDAAIAHGSDNAKTWQAKTEAQVKYDQQKYNVSDVQQLSARLSSQEKQQLCSIISQAKSKGMKDINLDLLSVSICK